MVDKRRSEIRTSTHLDPLALYEALRVGQYPEHHVLDGALLLEDHPGQIQQDLVPLHLQLRLLVEMRIS